MRLFTGPSTHTSPPTSLPSSPPISKRISVLAGAYGFIFLLILWAAYNNRLPLEWLSQFPNYDKVGHLVLYCLPSYLGHRLCRQKHCRNTWGNAVVSWPIFPGVFALFTVAEELIQGFSPYRTLDGGDMVCSVVGIVLGYWLAQRGACGTHH